MFPFTPAEASARRPAPGGPLDRLDPKSILQVHLEEGAAGLRSPAWWFARTRGAKAPCATQPKSRARSRRVRRCGSRAGPTLVEVHKPLPAFIQTGPWRLERIASRAELELPDLEARIQQLGYYLFTAPEGRPES